MSKEPLTVGRSTPRADTPGKVTGKERYAADYYPANLLWCGVKRPACAHAVIRHIHISRAKEMAGVIAVLTHEDITGSNRLGILEKDQPILANDTVRHYGDSIALVLAESREVLRQALESISVEYEPLAAVFDPEAAMGEDAPVIHPGRKNGNILLRDCIVQGLGAAALAECAFKACLELSLPWQEHAYLETEAGAAWLEEDGTLVIVASTQTPFRDRMELSHALGIPPGRIRVVAPYLGGGFGGKDGVTVQGFLALAALHAGGRPVKMWYSREESFLAGTKRHPALLKYSLGCDRHGILHALDCRIMMDTGAYASLGAEVLALAMEHAGGPYRIPHVSIEGAAVYTNNPVAGAFRGFGVPQVCAAVEQAIDELAKTADIDPLEFRLKNAVRRGDTTPAGVTLTQSTGISACLETARESALWRERKKWESSAPPFKKRGVGVAALCHGIGYGPVIPDTANAKIELTEKGRVLVYVGVADMGQGNAATYLQMAGDILCQSLDYMELVLPDTAQTLPSGSSSASRTTFTYGNALIGAAQTLRDRILARAALLLSYQLLEHIRPEDLALVPEGVRHMPTGREVPLALVSRTMDRAERVVTNSYTCPVNRQIPPTGTNLRIHGYPHRVYSFGVHLARIEADVLTGGVTVCDYLAVTDAGRVINPQLFEQQIHGGIAQGLGYALFEDFTVSEGKVLAEDFSTYILPTALDTPDVRSVAVPLQEEDGPYGMKGVGEIAINGAFPAVANALARACEARISRGPLTAERVLAAMNRNEGEPGS